jgi:hypothetical protein
VGCSFPNSDLRLLYSTLQTLLCAYLNVLPHLHDEFAEVSVTTCALHLHAINYGQEVHDKLWEISVLAATLGSVKLPTKLERSSYRAG